MHSPTHYQMVLRVVQAVHHAVHLILQTVQVALEDHHQRATWTLAWAEARPAVANLAALLALLVMQITTADPHPTMVQTLVQGAVMLAVAHLPLVAALQAPRNPTPPRSQDLVPTLAQGAVMLAVALHHPMAVQVTLDPTMDPTLAQVVVMPVAVHLHPMVLHPRNPVPRRAAGHTHLIPSLARELKNNFQQDPLRKVAMTAASLAQDHKDNSHWDLPQQGRSLRKTVAMTACQIEHHN
jgi:hypothetical protein